MKIQSSYAQNINLFDVAQNGNSYRKMSEIISESNNGQRDIVDISSEGMQAWRKQVQDLTPQAENVEERVITAADTNEVEYEHYSKMMEMSGDFYEKIRKDENREVNLNDIMKNMIDTYENLYNDIVKAHENGDREVDYKLTGKQSLTLEQDLAGLDKAFNRRLTNLDGYINSKQVTKQFEGSARDSYEYYKRVKGLDATQSQKFNDEYDYVNSDFKDSTLSIMQKAKDSLLSLINSDTYKRGIGVGIVSDMMEKNESFKTGYQKLF